MTVYQSIRAEILALGRKVSMALALCCYSVMEIEIQFSISHKVDSAAKAKKPSYFWARVPNTETSH